MLTKRVLELDLKSSLGKDVDLKEIALDHINALDEITSIEKTAAQDKQRPKQKLYQFSKNIVVN